ncbi:hypothetical protein ACS0TY_026151 [Phlomoides rotata]
MEFQCICTKGFGAQVSYSNQCSHSDKTSNPTTLTSFSHLNPKPEPPGKKPFSSALSTVIDSPSTNPLFSPPTPINLSDL